MSTSSKKSVTTTTVSSKASSTSSASAMATPVSRPGRQSPGRSPAGSTAAQSPETRSDKRSASPGLISRLKEKNELATLNDRLAVYIDRVRELEQENTRLGSMVHSQETVVRQEVTNIKGLYDGELASARKLLDEMASEKAKLQVEVGKLKSEISDLNDKLHARDKEFADADRRARSAESRLNELQLKLNEAEAQRGYLEADCKKLRKECDVLTKNLAVAKKQLEEETVARVDLENRCQSLKEELSFLNQVHEQEINESISRSSVVVHEADGRLKAEYDNQLASALRHLRDEMDDELQNMRDEADAVFQRRLNDSRVHSPDKSSDKAFAELRSVQKRLDEMSAENSSLNSQNASYEARIRDLDDQLRREREDHQVARDALSAEVRRLRDALDEQLHEFRDLMDVKIRLDTEISAYRKLLESEESRLNLSQEEKTSPRKRKLVEHEESSSFASGRPSGSSSSSARSDVVTSSSAKDVVKIDLVSPDGQFVRLINTSADKDVTVGSWQLRQLTSNNETTYKFPRNYELKAQKSVTVWSAKGGQSASPNNLVMKNQNWSAGDEVTATLLDQKGEELASYESRRSLVCTGTPARTETSGYGGASDAGKKAEQSSSKWRWSFFSFMK